MSQRLQNGFHLEKESHGTKMFLLAECEERLLYKEITDLSWKQKHQEELSFTGKEQAVCSNVLYLVYESACEVSLSLHSHFSIEKSLMAAQWKVADLQFNKSF